MNDTGGIMLTELIPECPRLHHGIMAVDRDAEYGVEYVCRLCGTRIYPDKPELLPDEIASEAGRPRKLPVYRRSPNGGKQQHLPNVCEKCDGPNHRRKNGRLCRKCRSR